MTRIIGTLLGVSFQTELLIMTLLGLANSTLDWKPFELVLRLNLIRDMHFSVDDVQLSSNFTSWIKKVLRVTVVVEFICSLLNPFAYILKLYPIITWSKAEILLPWLVIHALNTILPKMLSVALAFVFYSENIISTMSLIEFLTVESVNLLVAWYNWYVFFAFYLDLREVSKRRISRKSVKPRIRESFNSLPEIYSSIPNIHQILLEAPVNSVDQKQLRVGRSLTSLTENSSISQEVELDDTSLSSESSSRYLSPAEKSMKILSLTQEDLEDARQHKLRASSIYAAVVNDDACSCSSSEEEVLQILVSKKTQTRNRRRDDEGKEYVLKKDVIRTRPKHKLANRSTQTKNATARNNDDGAYFFLKRRFRAMDKMREALSFENSQQILRSNRQKWLLFQHELESNLRRHIFFKEPANTDSKRPTRDRPTQTEKIKRRNKDYRSRKPEGSVENEVIKSRWNYVSEAIGSSTEIFRKYAVAGIQRNEVTASKINDGSLAKSQLRATGNNGKYRRSSVPKTLRPIKWSEYTERPRAGRELRSLQAYNSWTLEQDRREMMQKRKKSRMTSYKNALTEIKNLNNKTRTKIPDTHPGNMREIIERLDWSIQSNTSAAIRIEKNPNRHWFVDNDNNSNSRSSSAQQPRHRGIVDDETVSALRNAFSHSDDNNERGFHLGADNSREPYPIFQVVAVTVAEILKATDWRNFTDATSSIRTENDVGIPAVNDVIFCGNNDNNDEIERRKIVSTSLLQELEELLDSSRETLSACEKLRSIADDSREILAKSAHSSRRNFEEESLSKNNLVDLFDRFYRNFLKHVESDDLDKVDFEKLTKTENFARFMALISDEEAMKAIESNDFDTRQR